LGTLKKRLQCLLALLALGHPY